MAQLIVLYFGDREDDDDLFTKLDFNDEVKAGNVVCLRVEKPDGKADENATAKSFLPPVRKSAKDLWAAYDVSEADTFVVADRFGNPYHTGKETALLTKLGGVNKHFRGVRKELRQCIADAKTARDKHDVAEALKCLKKGFDLGLNGYTEAGEAEKLYNELIDKGREKLKKADAATLSKLAATYEGTELEDEIKAARQDSN